MFGVLCLLEGRETFDTSDQEFVSVCESNLRDSSQDVESRPFATSPRKFKTLTSQEEKEKTEMELKSKQNKTEDEVWGQSHKV